jgi:catechol 2,3-dioxygenase-like lactoylglutathione lyase family enzyme
MNFQLFPPQFYNFFISNRLSFGYTKSGLYPIRVKKEVKMLTNASIHPTLPVVDLSRARKFYEEILGLKVIKTDPSPGVSYEAGGGTGLYIYQRTATKAEHTTASFSVEDVEAEVKELKAKGVVFEDVDVPGLKTVEGIATMTTPAGEFKGAWFKDTEGNILAVTNM